MNALMKTTAVAGLLAVSGVALADDNGLKIEANVTATTDYIFRGISQTDNNPAIQGGFDLALPAGFYVGVWGSNVAFGGSLEADYYGGWTKEFNDNFSLDIGYLYYDYPGTKNEAEDYAEYYISFGVYGVDIGYAYSPDFFGESDTAHYFSLGYDLPLPESFPFGVSLHLGRQTIDDNATFGTPDYTEWSVGISRNFLDVDWAVTYTDTNINENECFGGDNICDQQVTLSLSKSF